MITTTKKLSAKEKPTLKSVYFLNIDGGLTLEDYSLSADGKHLVSEADFEKYGKVEEWSDNDKVYYLKQFRGGRIGEILINPWSMMAKNTDLSSYATTRGERFCEYIKVKKDLFDGYKLFLETRDERYFAGVEKAVKDGDNL